MIVRDAIRDATRRLAAVGVPSPAIDARVLLAHCLGVPREALIRCVDDSLGADQQDRFARAMARRSAREPVSHIVREREFWSLSFAVDGRVLDPRPDSETLIEAALVRVADRAAPLRLLDLGTGSGCLLLALLSELPAAWGVGVDISPAAVAVARGNAGRLRMADRAQFAVADWGSCLRGPFDLILANPPYIADADMAMLEPEVIRYEPRLALAGGDGFSAYHAISGDLGRLLAPQGYAIVEYGHGQAAGVSGIFASAGLETVTRRRDLGGVERCVVLQRGRPG